MTPFSALEGLRIGCVQYLNAKPLIAPYEGAVLFEHPARLADLLAAGEIDMALVPAFEALRRPEFPIADGVAIASRGPVYSVFMAYRGELEAVRTVWLDPASRTSNHLVQCILAEFHGMRPKFELGAPDVENLAPGQAAVLIGNQAIRFREREREGMRYLDLGGEWMERTGLPFVFAVWQIRPETPEIEAVAEALRAVKCAGVRRARELGRLQRDFAPEFGEKYLTEYIHFDLGAPEKAGLARFGELLVKHGFLPRSGGELRFL